MAKDSFGDRLQELRKDKKITQETIANMLNTTRATYSRWETNTHQPSQEATLQLAKILDTTVSYLIGETDNPSKPQKKDLSDVTEVSYSDLDDPQRAMEFILKQPTMMAFGGYRLDLMDEDEIVEFAQQMLSLMKMAAERYKNKK